MSRVFALLLAVLSSGCADYFANSKENLPGDSVGYYSILANADMGSSCTEIINATPRPWTFDVSLRREGTKGYWLSGASPIEGTVDGKGQLYFKQTIRVPVHGIDKVNGIGACTILRTDDFVGALAGAPTSDEGKQTFTGTLRYSYQVEPGSDCRDVVGAQTEGRKNPLFSVLPCDARFAVTATRLGDKKPVQ